MKTDNRITEILAYFRGGVANIYTQKKLDELDEELKTQNWKEFIKEIKTIFSDKMKDQISQTREIEYSRLYNRV